MDFEWITFLDAIALVFIIEGIMPFMMPEIFRKYMESMKSQPDMALRIIGLVSMVLGCVILYLVRIFFDF